MFAKCERHRGQQESFRVGVTFLFVCSFLAFKEENGNVLQRGKLFLCKKNVGGKFRIFCVKSYCQTHEQWKPEADTSGKLK